MRQAPRKRSGPAAHFMGYYSTPVRILQGGCGRGFPRGGGQGLGMGGIVLACALLQRGDWLGLRRPSAGGLAWPAPLSRPHRPPTFLGTGGLAAPPGGTSNSLHPPWRDEEGAVVPPSPPSDAFGNRGTRCTPGGGCAPCTLLGEMRKAPSFHLAHRPTLLGTGGLTILPRKQRPLHPARRRSRACFGASGRFPACPRVRVRGQSLIVCC